MKYRFHSHMHADRVIPALIRKQIEESISSCTTKACRGTATTLRRELSAKLAQKGWPIKVRIDTSSKITITSLKDDIGLCLQMGNMGRVYADLLKLQTTFLQRKIKAGVIIVAVKRVAMTMGQNIVNFERLVGELAIFSKTITMPLLVIGIAE